MAEPAPSPGRFVGEPIAPDTDTFDALAMAVGTPGLPRRFRWRNADWQVAQVLSQWRTTGPCSHGGGERYVRRHWFEVLTAEGPRMRLYCDRQARSRSRWWIYSIDAQ